MDQWFGLQRDSMIAILVMGAITFAFRGGGYWLMGRITLSPKVEAGLAYLPGAVITALVVPGALEAGVPGILGVVMVAIVMRIHPNLLFGMAAGIVAVVLTRLL